MIHPLLFKYFEIAFLSFSDYRGGANIVAHSIYKTLKNNNNLKSYITVYSNKKKKYEIYKFLGKLYINILRSIEKIIIIIFNLRCKFIIIFEYL